MNRLLAYGALKIHYDANHREIWEPIHRNHLLHLDDLEILKQYNAEIRGLYNYYKIAGNVSVLNNFNYAMKFSMFKTFAAKYKSGIGKVRAKYRVGKDFGVRYETRKGWKTLLFYNGGFRNTDSAAREYFDSLPNTYCRTGPNSLIVRLKVRKCEWCGAADVFQHDRAQVVHINAVADGNYLESQTIRPGRASRTADSRHYAL